MKTTFLGSGPGKCEQFLETVPFEDSGEKEKVTGPTGNFFSNTCSWHELKNFKKVSAKKVSPIL